MKTKALMIQGTTSDAGKSALVTALCRYYHRRGINVAPFKPQNMALNSAVTEDGGEIGRAQAVQAAACGLAPHSDMNPLLLKPHSDKTAQLVVQGRALKHFSAGEYHHYKKQAKIAMLESWRRLGSQYDLIIVEGAGSPAEINLREGDIANMGFAEAVDCPVILIADIERGGVFAHIIGTLALLSESEQRRVIGFVINRFRGEVTLLKPGIDWLEKKTGKPVLAVLPYLPDFYLEAEDSLSKSSSDDAHANRFRVVVPALPRLSNHTDFDPLLLHPNVQLEFVKYPTAALATDFLILPGSKSVRDDLVWLKTNGWQEFINRHLRYGGKVLGICGGYQMLGHKIYDKKGMEGVSGSSKGLGLLKIDTQLQTKKQIRRISGLLYPCQTAVSGYEIHIGDSYGADCSRPVMKLDGQDDGARSADNLVMGTYLHGLFDLPDACEAILKWAGCRQGKGIDLNERREQGINQIADAVEQFFNFSLLETLCGIVLR